MASGGQDRLRRATHVYLREIVEGGRQLEEVLREHDDLADVLGPMADEDGAHDDGTREDGTREDGTRDDGTREDGTREDGEVAGDRTPADARVIDGFRLLREIGRGGMGVVYEAQQVALQRRVALKLLAPERSARPDAMVRFRHEAASIASLDHPGIVGVHTTGTSEGARYIAMDLVHGAPLDAVLEALREQGEDTPDRERLPRALESALGTGGGEPSTPIDPAAPSYIGKIVEIVAQVAEALAHAHERGVIHRDVKPANILLRPDGRAVLTDFGLSRLCDTASVTATGGLNGTLYYLSPEQIDGGEVDHRADVFALGVTLYELTTLRRPFEGATPPRVMQAIVHDEPQRPERINPQLPPDLVAITSMALEKDPAQRYRSAAAFAADLRAFLDYRPVSAHRPGPARRVVRWIRREPLRAATIGLSAVAVLLLAGFAGYLIAKQPELRAGAAAIRTAELDELLTEGFLELGEGSRERAASFFRAAFELEPDSVEALAGLAISADVEAGLALLDRESRALSDHRAVRRLRLHLLRQAGRDGEADALERELGPPGEALEHYIAGLHAIERGHAGESECFGEAARSLRRAVLLSDRPRPVFYFEWTHAVGHVRDRAAAEECTTALEMHWPDSWKSNFWITFAWMSVDPARAVESARRAIAGRRDSWILWRNLAVAAHRAGELATARDAFVETLRIRRGDLEAWLDLSVVHEKLEDPASAERAIERAIELHPRAVTAHTTLAMLRAKQGDREGSAEALARAAEIDPDHPTVLRCQGIDRLKRGDAQGAADALQAAIDADPQDSSAHFYLGVARAQLGERDAARAAYEACLRVNPDHPEAMTNLANCLSRDGDPAGAEQLLRRAIAVMPTLAPPYGSLSYLLESQGRVDDHRQHLDVWVETLPDDPLARARRAWFRLWHGGGAKTENARAALADAERAEQLSRGRDPMVLNIVGCVQLHAGHLQTAEATFVRGLEMARRHGNAKLHDLITTHLDQCRQVIRQGAPAEERR